MSNYSKFYFLLFSILLSINLSAKIHEFETTHLKSTGGSGAGSILLEESAFLNPAAMVFFTAESIFFQKDTLKTTDSVGSSYPNKKDYAFVLSQAAPELSGTISYITQNEENIYRKRWGVSLAGQIAPTSSMGVSVRSTNDINYNNNQTTKYYQTVIGITHSVSESTSIGIVAYDPFKSKGDETKALIGIQQGLLNYISGTLDLGTDYTSSDISKKIIVKGSIQVKLLDDFFLRVGGFNDKIRLEKGEGFGLAWIQPKLAFEFAIKNTRSTIGTTEKTNKDTSFSISLRGF